MNKQRAAFIKALGFDPKAVENIDHAGAGKIEFKETGDNSVEVLIYEQIGFDWLSGEGVTAKAFKDEVESHKGKDLTVRINSPGGDVWDGIAMFNILLKHEGKVTTVVDGIAASAASIVALAADSVQMHETAQFMIHSAWTVAGGNSEVLREVADVLEKVDTQLADVYAKQTGKDREYFLDLMSKDNYYTAEESLELGLADEVIEIDRDEYKASSDNRINAGARKRMLALRKAKLGL